MQVMLFCEYPFERPNDAKDHRRFTLVQERVMNVQYSFPEGE
jgi:serine/threonine-protein kinase SRK2